ncbi:hypothetical protein [Mycobacterium sp. NAZ190054]|uniref:hypothetical protein n=1 Tax=Mycobacterium sp. NAZ190054 TaxID=1747766 RepID=UPI0007957D0C|nr:hypothetical protein [Mycobacterium sp. NAZ190054]KWX56730.1 hypothetical protein ASJ79_02155 [Mycobacterium sp. NAZ190054]
MTVIKGDQATSDTAEHEVGDRPVDSDTLSHNASPSPDVWSAVRCGGDSGRGYSSATRRGLHRQPWYGQLRNVAARAVPVTPRTRWARVQVLAGSLLGVGCLVAAHRLQPDSGSLFAPPTRAVEWLVLVCGVVGVWLVPGLWLSALLMRTGAGPAGWLGSRIATTLAWYVLVGPTIHFMGEGARVTPAGVLIATVAATAAVCAGLVLGLSSRPSRFWQRVLLAALIGGGCAQLAMWTWMSLWSAGMNYSHIRRLGWAIVLVCAVLVMLGTLSRPKLPGLLTKQNLPTLVVVLLVLVGTVTGLLATAARWSPAQRMPSAYGIEQIPAPPGVDAAFALTPMGGDGGQLIQRATFAGFDMAGREVPVDARLDGGGPDGRVSLLITLQDRDRSAVCARPSDDTARTGGPAKLTIRDLTSRVRAQAVFPDGWCSR